MKYFCYLFALILFNSCANYEGYQTYSADTFDINNDENNKIALLTFLTEGLINIKCNYNDDMLECDDGYYEKEHIDWDNNMQRIKITMYNCKLISHYDNDYENIVLNGSIKYWVNDNNQNCWDINANPVDININNIKGALTFKMTSGLNSITKHCNIDDLYFNTSFNINNEDMSLSAIENISEFTNTYFSGGMCNTEIGETIIMTQNE